MLKIQTSTADANSRPIGLRFALMTLRMLERWRSHLDADLDAALIVMATAAITMEKFTRANFDPEHRDIRCDMQSEKLTRCNVSSIAAATGLNRETTRRKVNSLLASGVLVKEGTSLRLNADYTRSIDTEALLRSLLETLTHSSNELIRLGVLSDV